MTTPTKPPTAFLSHATKDGETALRLATDLQKNGIEVWHSEWEIQPGDSLRRRIDAGIDGATHFLVLLTPLSLKSEWVQTELDAGLVNRIAGKCRLIPILLGISNADVPATLRGLLWVDLGPYEDGLRRLVEACHGVSTKPPLGQPPPWASERPLEGAGLSATAQRLAAWLNQRSEYGYGYDLFRRDDMMADLGVTAEQIGIAASELEDRGHVKPVRDSGSGVARFTYLKAQPPLFIETDPMLRGWNPEKDARELAAALINLLENDHHGVPLVSADQHLGWGPRRLNPAADYLDLYGYVKVAKNYGSKPYSYGHAFVTPRTRRFAEWGE